MALCSLSDAELWNLILRDNYRAFTTLFDRYWHVMYKSAKRYLHDTEASEEVIHDLFLNIWNRREHLIIQDFERYFKAALRYQVYAYVRKQKNVPLQYTDQLQQEHPHFAMDAADDALSYRELESKLNRYLDLLPGRCREIFILSRIQNYSNGEIAEKLGINKRTVENQLTHALHAIRMNMKNILYSLLLVLSVLSDL